MASHPGIWALNCSPMIKTEDATNGLVPFMLGLSTAVGTATYRVHSGHAPFSYIVLGVRGIMQAAGAAGDTVQVFGHGGSAITEVINLAALVDHATFAAQTLDLTGAGIIRSWSDDLVIVTASDAQCIVMVDCLRAEFTGGI